ncbi:MAG: HAD-IB family phosphatase [Alphaproteobacteria bacterium]|nr:HAD-IB family phosphatase [Alphaproteobacteria bacterium]
MAAAIEGAVVFDLDGTRLRWQMFHMWIKEMVAQGLLPQVVCTMAEKELEGYHNREAPFNDWVSQQVRAYSGDNRMEGIRVEDVKFVARKVVREMGKRVHVFPQCLSEAAKACGIRRAIISGTPIEVVEAFALADDISIYLGSELEKRGLDGMQRYTGRIEKEWVLDKCEAIHFLAEENGFVLKHSVAIGDSSSDALMLREVEYPICFNPDQRLRNKAIEYGWPIVVERKDCIHMFRHSGPRNIQLLNLSDFLPEGLAAAMAQLLPPGSIV